MMNHGERFFSDNLKSDSCIIMLHLKMDGMFNHL